MSAAFGRMDIVGVRENRLMHGVGPLQCNFDIIAFTQTLEEDHVVQHVAALVQRFDKLLNAALVMELFLLADPFVAKPHLESGIQVRHFAQIAGDSVVFEFDLGKDRGVRRKGGLGASEFGRAALLDFALRNAAFVALEINRAVLADLDLEFLAERVDDRRADAMQTAGNFVDTAHYFECRALLSRMHIHRNSAAIILDGDAVVAMNNNINLGAEAGQRFVNRVVDDLGDQVVQSTFGSVADIHAGPFTNRFEPLQNFDRIGAVTVGSLFVCHK